ncbi:MAG: hypothetical protein AAF681_14665, partial [Pseudomonadota bacterium]
MTLHFDFVSFFFAARLFGLWFTQIRGTKLFPHLILWLMQSRNRQGGLHYRVIPRRAPKSTLHRQHG